MSNFIWLVASVKLVGFWRFSLFATLQVAMTSYVVEKVVLLFSVKYWCYLDRWINVNILFGYLLLTGNTFNIIHVFV